MNLPELISEFIDKVWGFKHFRKKSSPEECMLEIRKKLVLGGYYVSPHGLIMQADDENYNDNLGEIRIGEGRVIISPNHQEREEVIRLQYFLKEKNIPYRDRTKYR